MRCHFSGRLCAVLLFAALNAADAVTTQLGLMAGIGEGSPGAAMVLARGGMAGFVGLKAGLTVAALRIPYFAAVGSAVLAAAVASNLALLQQVRP